MDAGLMFAFDKSESPPLPEEGIDVTMTEAFDEFKGTVIPADNSIATLQISRTRGTVTLLLSEHIGRIWFSDSRSH